MSTYQASDKGHEENIPTAMPTYSSPDSTDTANDPAQPRTTQSTSQYLERLTLGLIEGVNSRKFEAHPSIAYFSSDWKAQSNDQSISYPMDQHFEITRQLTIDHPELWIHVVNVSTQMGYRDLCADVYVDMEHTGYPPGVVRTTIGVFHWKQFDEENGKKKWLCVRHTGARGFNWD